jgi:hypothetical protein
MTDYTDDLQLIDASELGKLIGRATTTLKQDLRRRPDTLPPPTYLPGSNRPRWRLADVRAWLQALADLEVERRAAAVEATRRAGLKPDFGYKPFALAAAKNGRRARSRMEETAAQTEPGEKT